MASSGVYAGAPPHRDSRIAQATRASDAGVRRERRTRRGAEELDMRTGQPPYYTHGWSRAFRLSRSPPTPGTPGRQVLAMVGGERLLLGQSRPADEDARGNWGAPSGRAGTPPTGGAATSSSGVPRRPPRPPSRWIAGWRWCSPSTPGAGRPGASTAHHHAGDAVKVVASTLTIRPSPSRMYTSRRRPSSIWSMNVPPRPASAPNASGAASR